MGDISKDIQSSFPSERIKALVNLKYTANWLNKISDKIFSEFGISAQQYNILRILRGAGEAINVKTVKERMIEVSPNSTRLMDKLVEKKLICRERCNSDKRNIFIEITKEGLELVERIKLDDSRLQLKVLSEKELEELNRILDKIRVD